MLLTSYRLARRIFFFLAIVLAFAVSLFGVGGVFVFGGRPSHFADIFYVYYPLLAFPISLVALLYPRIGVVGFSLYVLGNWLFEFVISWPEIAINPFDSLTNSALVCGAVLFWVGLLFSFPTRSPIV